MDKQILKQIMLENQNEIQKYDILPRNIAIEEFHCYVLVGVRLAGKSFMLFHRINSLLKEGRTWDEILYLNFEDERLEGFQTADLNQILECHAELYGKRPILFLDEIQNIAGWEKFARRLADSKYSVYITGSNAKMLSREIMTTLGGRYVPIDIYPYSFKEFLEAHKVKYDERSLMITELRASFMRTYSDYFNNGGMPEAALLPSKRNYLSSVYQKIYLSDIIARNKVSNTNALRLMIKKLAESVRQPISYNRIANILSSIGGRLSVPTVINYIGYAEEAWLILRLKNLAASTTERESVCKYYFIDNGIMHLFLLDADTALLENLVALCLFRRYGYNTEDDRVFFYNDKIEVDFYIPEEEWAIQVSYSLHDEETKKRELGALSKLPKVLSCHRRTIITYDEEDTLHDAYGDIEVVPCWKWMIE